MAVFIEWMKHLRLVDVLQESAGSQMGYCVD